MMKIEQLNMYGSQFGRVPDKEEFSPHFYI